MNYMRDILKGVGVISIVLGIMCLPMGASISPRVQKSLFALLADAGVGIKTGFVLISAGVFLFLLSLFLSKCEKCHDQKEN